MFLAFRDWIDSVLFGCVFLVGTAFLHGRAAADFDNWLAVRLRDRRRKRHGTRSYKMTRQRGIGPPQEIEEWHDDDEIPF